MSVMTVDIHTEGSRQRGECAQRHRESRQDRFSRREISGPRLSREAIENHPYVYLGDDAAESFVVGVVVAPDDVPADHAGLSLWLAWSVPSSAKYRNAVNCASMRF